MQDFAGIHWTSPWFRQSFLTENSLRFDTVVKELMIQKTHGDLRQIYVLWEMLLDDGWREKEPWKPRRPLVLDFYAASFYPAVISDWQWKIPQQKYDVWWGIIPRKIEYLGLRHYDHLPGMMGLILGEDELGQGFSFQSFAQGARSTTVILHALRPKTTSTLICGCSWTVKDVWISCE